jgi:hypothetical protein
LLPALGGALSGTVECQLADWVHRVALGRRAPSPRCPPRIASPLTLPLVLAPCGARCAGDRASTTLLAYAGCASRLTE